MKSTNWMFKALLCALLFGCCGHASFSQSCGQMAYLNQNQIDYRLGELGQIRGTGVDPDGITISHQLCVGIFSESEHKLLRFGQGDDNGVFVLETNGLPDGEYRLVIQVIGFCPANAIIRIKARSRKKRSLVARMRPSAIDTCSSIEVRKN
jgi:hypothetical protein